jgi:hypothetical protein
MQTKIIITGQLNSIFMLRSVIKDYNCEETRGMFNAVTLTFKTKREAVKALSEGRKYLKSNDKDYSYSYGYSLSYDAATAIITNKHTNA